MLKIKYRKWEGSTNEKTELHVSHVPFESESKIPDTQEIQSNCVLCPVKKYLKDNWDRDRHYNAVHIACIIVIEDVIALQCKCSAVRSQGWQKDKATHNAHYHCTKCHWPRDRISQSANHMVTKHDVPPNVVNHLRPNRED